VQMRNCFHLCSVAVLGVSLAGCAMDGDELTEAVDTTTAPLYAADAARSIPDRYIVVFRDQIGASSVEAAVSRIALKSSFSRIDSTFTVIPGFAARLSADDLAAIRQNPDVAYVERDQLVEIDTAVWPAARAQLASQGGDLSAPLSSEPELGVQTIYPLPGGQPDGIDRVDQPSLPRNSQYDDNGCAGAGARAYVIDTGIRARHVEVRGRVSVARGFTAISDGRGTDDCIGQGTYLASIIGGAQLGLARLVTLVPVRVMSCTGSGTTSAIINGVNHVNSDCGPNDACVATLALGGSFSSALNSAVASLVASGVPVTAPVGTSGCSGSPASEPSVTAVAGVNDLDCPVTTTGPCVDLHGPSTTILGASISSDTATQTLTSTGAAMAHVAGALVQGMSCGYTGTRTTPATCASPPGTVSLIFNDYGAESCTGRCDVFDGLKPCQCDDGCAASGDCCADVALACP
jgi:subtilisin family serine protease